MITPKKDGSQRQTIALLKQNNATLCETHHTLSPFNILSVIPKNSKKTILDAWNGYHSIEWGIYRYLRAPQGFHASNDTLVPFFFVHD